MDLSKRQDQIAQLEKKEKKAYEAFAALISFVKGIKKQNALKISDFSKFKKAVLASGNEFVLRQKSKTCANETKFNVKHYERAILCASDATYRDMAIQAANKDLTPEAMQALIIAIRKDCQLVSRQLKELLGETRKRYPVVQGVRQLWQQVVARDEETEPAAV
jgi:inorganic triphosphatase YgiF